MTIVLGPLANGTCLCGVDLDSCRDPKTGALTRWAQEIIEKFKTYTEVSPSGSGVKFLFLVCATDLPAVETLFGGQQGRTFKRGDGKHPPSIEIYRGGRYFAVTDESIGPTDILRRVSRADLDWLLREAGPKFVSSGGSDQSRSAKAFRRGIELKAAGLDYEQFHDALLNDADPDIRAWTREKGLANGERELNRIYKKASPGCDGRGVTLEDFRAHMPTHAYIFVPCREMWPASSVNARVPPVPLVDKHGAPILDETGKQKMQPAAAWLDQNRPVECMTWAPGAPEIIANQLISGGGWISRPGCGIFNLYRPPQIALGDAMQAGPWLAHGEKIFGEGFGNIKLWLAHRVQKPGEKINHALVLGGAQGVGKDTLLEPVKRAVGHWNFHEVSPSQVLGRFNGYLKSVILRINEARDLGEYDRYKFYDHLKALTAAPPDVLPIDEKNLREYTRIASVLSTQPTIKRTAFICPPMTAATLWPGPISRKRIFRLNIGTAYGPGTKKAATAM
jgi:Family of unknown function (DUF5906)